MSEQVEGAAFTRGGLDELKRLQRGLAICPRIGQAILLAAQCRLLVRILEVGGCDFVDLVAQDVSLTGALLLVAPEAGQGVVERPQLAPHGAQAAQVRAGEGIEHVALGSGGDQGPVLVLPVDLDQFGCGFPQRSDWRHAPVDPGLRPSLGGHRAGKDHLPLLVAVADHEPGLDERLGGAGAHHALVGASPEDQLQRLHDERLARPGLAGERGHAGAELDGQVLDHAQVADVQVGQHGIITRPVGPGAGSAGWCRRCAARSGPPVRGAPRPCR